MLGFLITIHTIVSLFLVTSILMQASQGGGLAGSFGGQASNAILGSRGTASMLSKITTWLVVMFMALAILISLVGSSLSGDSSTSILQEAVEEGSLAPGAELSLPGVQIYPQNDQ
ncbi:MAG: preprotein translocase subunit SecG [Candidatus Marinimicrobia bacterium]|jgi:preprotein translocase subunit SecG|nr:preprotein translocase subunit SecG [Candidatus Neomarinimicrobiota bacterium]MBT3618588.1 preprotein translocase subunit SecG [Candidatus Neomarinimicrobiota bacterium]MBT3829620.1 preprotein translocase subunit SecG [Candidatus Neomarinimicrobiota bacterium]MBT3997701.1 preprotein translocase subunit SecG [Candidatus Neomarinimicrobiota bacterium]MBT4281026.1 preprotein translocase subunit SecG [Candidatus Neomarinimicrobiota bacterium]